MLQFFQKSFSRNNQDSKLIELADEAMNFKALRLLYRSLALILQQQQQQYYVPTGNCQYEHFWFQKRPFIIMYCLDNNCRFGNQNICGDRLQHQYIINIIVKCRLFYIYIYTRPCALLNKNNDIALSLFFKKGSE